MATFTTVATALLARVLVPVEVLPANLKVTFVPAATVIVFPPLMIEIAAPIGNATTVLLGTVIAYVPVVFVL